MSEVKLPNNVSPALARFADVLCMYQLELFSQQLGALLKGPPCPLDERAIMFRLADYAVHVCATELLEAQDRRADAERLRGLPPIVDQGTARAAKQIADALENKPVEHARGAAHFAACDPCDECAPARAAEHAAYAVAQTASSYTNPQDAERVYTAAVELLTRLRTPQTNS